MTALPDSAPRPPGELEALERIWRRPGGVRVLTEYNNTFIGLLYVATALLFFLLAGVLALVMRTQLAVPANDLVKPELYNQLFTMHGTVMMFLFAVPAVEAMGVLLLPNMLGARDMPFPRLSSYAYWAYAMGGIVFFASLFFGAAPRGGWFMNPPLTNANYSPGVAEDFWLLGIGFIEISAIAGAVEIIVGILRTRAPGMTLARMPVFAWSMLVFAVMVVFAFPAVILATLQLELERAFHWPFFDAARGGAPLLWQHLFWFFGHPEVYIIFLPAVGMVSTIVPTMVHAPLVGYRMVVLALVATGLLSFGLWVHHMFTTGIPRHSLAFFQAASMAVALPAGVQVFSWIATVARAKARITTPSLFILGFLFTFVIGGLTGVMLAAIPFDWQAHDSYFVVAHLHYVLIGGMVFPLFAAFYYWIPMVSRQALSERLGRWVFGLMFGGFHLAFFPMHVTGLAGMPRRVHTYAPGAGWDALNLASTVGAFTIAAGVALFLFDLARRLRPDHENHAGNVWDAGTLEWLPSGSYGARSLPVVESREPLLDRPTLPEEVREGRWYLPGAPTGWREALITSALATRPQYVLRMPPLGWAPFVAAAGTAGFFLLLTGKLLVPASLFGLVALAALAHWAWVLEPAPLAGAVDIGLGTSVPAHANGPVSTGWWAVIVLLAVSTSLYGSALFSYFYLWAGNPSAWPPASMLPGLGYPALSSALGIASSVLVACARRSVERDHPRAAIIALALGLATLTGMLATEGVAQSTLDPAGNAYSAGVWLLLVLGAFFAAVVAALTALSIARLARGRLDRERRMTFDTARLFWHYTVAQTLVGLALVHGFPRLVGP